jgi:hypothetical protein
MNFIEWTKQQENNNPIAANPKTIKTRQERDRLTRMEATLNQLLLRQVIVEAKAFQRPEKKHVKT